MEDKLTVPELDLVALGEKAKEAAMAGALKEIEDYYGGYNSPYREQVKEALSKTKVSTHLDLPNIMGLINDTLSKEIDQLANSALAESFIPLLNQFLSAAPKEIKLSDILREFISAGHSYTRDDYTATIGERDGFGWLDVKLSVDKMEYNLTLHKDSGDESKYCLLSLPYNYSAHHRTMKLKVGDGELDLPFTPRVLEDSFLSYAARIIMSKSIITVDCQDFEDDMFPEDHCNC